MQAMMVFEDVQKKAREEIDRVVGPDRLPQVEDYPNLPYIRCCIKENLYAGCQPSSWESPHRAMKEDIYNGWTIPQGATVINNVW